MKAYVRGVLGPQEPADQDALPGKFPSSFQKKGIEFIPIKRRY